MAWQRARFGRNATSWNQSLHVAIRSSDRVRSTIEGALALESVCLWIWLGQLFW